MAIYQLFKWPPSAVLDFFVGVFRSPRRVFSGLVIFKQNLVGIIVAVSIMWKFP